MRKKKDRLCFGNRLLGLFQFSKWDYQDTLNKPRPSSINTDETDKHHALQFMLHQRKVLG